MTTPQEKILETVAYLKSHDYFNMLTLYGKFYGLNFDHHTFEQTYKGKFSECYVYFYSMQGKIGVNPLRPEKKQIALFLNNKGLHYLRYCPYYPGVNKNIKDHHLVELEKTSREEIQKEFDKLGAEFDRKIDQLKENPLVNIKLQSGRELWGLRFDEETFTKMHKGAFDQDIFFFTDLKKFPDDIAGLVGINPYLPEGDTRKQVKLELFGGYFYDNLHKKTDIYDFDYHQKVEVNATTKAELRQIWLLNKYDYETRDLPGDDLVTTVYDEGNPVRIRRGEQKYPPSSSAASSSASAPTAEISSTAAPIDTFVEDNPMNKASIDEERLRYQELTKERPPSEEDSLLRGPQAQKKKSWFGFGNKGKSRRKRKCRKSMKSRRRKYKRRN
jgi:hypothetical protein